MTATLRFRDLTGLDPGGFPLLAERLAVDVTSALRSAEAGLRGLRGRIFLRRLWDVVSGQGGELQGAIGSDLAAVQRATLDILREVMREDARTQHCMNRVLVNLHAINRDLDAVAGGLARAEAGTRELRRELFEALGSEAVRLAGQIERLRRELVRESTVRHLSELYRAGELHRGAGPTLAAAMFLAAVGAACWDPEPERRAWVLSSYRRVAEAIVRERLSSRPQPTEVAVLEAVESTEDPLREPLLYLSENRGPHLATVSALLERKLAGLGNAESNARDALAVARATRDPERHLESHLIRPIELAQALARELEPEGAA